MPTGEICAHGFALATNIFGTISSDLTQYSSYYAHEAADNGIGSSWWVGIGTSGYWQLDMGSGRAATLYSYKLQCPTSVLKRMPKSWVLKGSNNGSDWTTLDTVSDETGWSFGEERTYTCDTQSGLYRYFRIDISANNGDATYIEIKEVWLYTDYTTVVDSGWGSNLFTDTDQISSESEYSASYKDDYTVDDNDATRWSSGDGHVNSWLKYDFGVGESAQIEKLSIKGFSASGSGVNLFMFWGSDDDSDWDLLCADMQADDETLQSYTFQNLTSYRYYQLVMQTGRGAGGECSMYTLEAYEKEASGWTGKINGVTDPAKINGIAVADIAKVNGIE